MKGDTIDVDHVFEHIGTFGLYQKRLLLFMAYVEMIAGSCLVLLPTFTAAEPKWTCSQSSSSCNVTGEFGPTDDNYGLRCDIGREDWEFVPTFTSIMTQWDLVCEKSILQSVAQSIVFAGWFLGLPLFGMMADKYGRKPAVFLSTVLTCATGFLSAFSQWTWMYILFRFLTGVGVGGAVMAAVVLSAEFCGVEQRGIAASIPWFGWGTGNGLLPLFAYCIRDWRHLTMAISAPGLLVILFWWFVDESPRWLMISGREEDADKVLRKVAALNGSEMPAGKLTLPVERPENSKNGNFMDLFRNRFVTKITLVMWFAWFCASLQSYGAQFAAVAMSGNLYLNAFIVGIALFPCTVLSIYLQEKCGRRIAIVICLVVAFLGSIVSIFLPNDPDDIGAIAARIICFFIVKVTAAGAFNIVYVFAAELYPTMTRNVGMSWCSAIARIGSFSSPFIIWMQHYHAAIPMAIMGACSFTAAILVLTLHETKSTPTLETVAEMNVGVKKLKRGSDEAIPMIVYVNSV